MLLQLLLIYHAVNQVLDYAKTFQKLYVEHFGLFSFFSLQPVCRVSSKSMVCPSTPAMLNYVMHSERDRSLCGTCIFLQILLFVAAFFFFILNFSLCIYVLISVNILAG